MTTKTQALAVADRRCACVSHDADSCFRIRYGIYLDEDEDFGDRGSEYCDCDCHEQNYEDCDDGHE